MMRYIFYILFIFIFSCQSVEKVEKPDQLIKEEKMVDILTDLAILRSAKDVNSDRLSKFIEEPFDHITRKYNIDSLTLEKNIEYYNFQFNKNLSIYRRVEENIAKKKAKLDSIDMVMDSLKKHDKKKIKESNNKKKIAPTE